MIAGALEVKTCADTMMQADTPETRDFDAAEALEGAIAWLREAGVGHAEWTRHCTYSDPDRFFSYRRATHQGEADYGRLISAIRL